MIFLGRQNIASLAHKFGAGESLRLTPPRARVADLHPGADMGVAGSTQRLRPLVNPDGSIGIKVRTRRLERLPSIASLIRTLPPPQR